MRRRGHGLRAPAALLTAAVLVMGAGATSAAAGVAILPAAPVDAEWNHDPESPAGPSAWGDLDPAWSACRDGAAQSPIDLRPSGAPADLPPLAMTYETVPLVVLNNGHTVEVPQPEEGGGTLQVGSDRYTLLQWHVHAPSEHVLRGHRYDMEIHLVHRDDAGRLAVVAVLADDLPRPPHGRRPSPPSAAARSIDDVLSRAPAEPEEVVVPGVELNASSLLFGGIRAERTVRTNRYVAYSGSLTTPPCTEGVRWFVLTPKVRVFADSVATLHDLVAAFPSYGGYDDNNRPLQPLNGRTLERPH